MARRSRHPDFVQVPQLNSVCQRRLPMLGLQRASLSPTPARILIPNGIWESLKCFSTNWPIKQLVRHRVQGLLDRSGWADDRVSCAAASAMH